MKPLNRRQFITSTVAITTIGPLFFLVGPTAHGNNEPKLEITDPQAKALSYTLASPQADNVCANCQLYNGTVDAAWGPSPSFQVSKSPGPDGAALGLRKQDSPSTPQSLTD